MPFRGRLRLEWETGALSMSNTTLIPEQEQEARSFISQIIGRSVEGPFGDTLKDGVILCEFMNKLKPGSIAKINKMKAPFMQMENIGNYLAACRNAGIAAESLFMTVDLFEQKNLAIVALHIIAAKRHFGFGFQRNTDTGGTAVFEYTPDKVVTPRAPAVTAPAPTPAPAQTQQKSSPAPTHVAAKPSPAPVHTQPKAATPVPSPTPTHKPTPAPVVAQAKPATPAASPTPTHNPKPQPNPKPVPPVKTPSVQLLASQGKQQPQPPGGVKVTTPVQGSPTSSKAIPPAPVLFCPACGTKVVQGGLFCAQCGHRF